MATHNDLGKKGENLAIDFLRLKNYTILETNWRYGKAEIDIIGKDGETLVFLEVKTRSANGLSRPEEAVNFKKQTLITYAAPRYMEKINHDWAIRFDILSIIVEKNGQYTIEHLEDAFY